SVRPKPGRTLGFLNRHPAVAMAVVMLPPLSVDLVENAAIAEIGGLRFLPSTEIFNGCELQVGETLQIGRIDALGLEGAIVMPGGDLLALLRVEIVKIGLGHLAGTLGVDISV